MLLFSDKGNIVDCTKNEMKRFIENDNVVNAVSALDLNSPCFTFNINSNHSGGKILVTTSIGSVAS